MITLNQWLKAVNYRVSNGEIYLWTSFGPNAHILEVQKLNKFTLNIIFDSVTETIYAVEICDYVKNIAYNMINKDYKKAYELEAESRNCSTKLAWENVNFAEIETDEDFLEKLKAVFNEKEYDTRISIPLEFEEEILITLFKMAHEKDITLNKLIGQIIEERINDTH